MVLSFLQPVHIRKFPTTTNLKKNSLIYQLYQLDTFCFLYFLKFPLTSFFLHSSKFKKSDGSTTEVAIKKISDVLHDLVDAKRLLREIEIGRHLTHQENIISTVDVLVTRRSTTDEDDLYIVTDLFPTDLHRVIHSKNVPLGGDHVKFFLWQLLCATKYMHSGGVVHRDLKPSNILVNSECDLRVCDFGLARGLENESSGKQDAEGNVLEPQEEEFMTEYVVTRWYRAPEILLGSRDYKKSVDIWSVGCVFAEMLARRALFPGENSLDQVTRIMKVLGTFSEDDILDFASDAACRWVRKKKKNFLILTNKIYFYFFTDTLKFFNFFSFLFFQCSS